tara:strand:+ start:286 stop:489 length:204 start_codon:yes stop_codon:yes gene_type:complete
MPIMKKKIINIILLSIFILLNKIYPIKKINGNTEISDEGKFKTLNVVHGNKEKMNSVSSENKTFIYK